MIDTEKVGPALTGETAWPLPPWAADTEMVEREKIDPAAAGTEKADIAPVGSDDDDIVEILPAATVLTGGRHLGPRPPEQQVLGPVPVQNSAGKKRFRSRAMRGRNRRRPLKRLVLKLRNRRLPLKWLVLELLVLVVLVILNVVLLELLLSSTR